MYSQIYGYTLSSILDIKSYFVTVVASVLREILSRPLRKHKNKLWKKYLSTCSPTDLSNFKKVNNQLRNLTRNLKRLMKNN